MKRRIGRETPQKIIATYLLEVFKKESVELAGLAMTGHQAVRATWRYKTVRHPPSLELDE